MVAATVVSVGWSGSAAAGEGAVGLAVTPAKVTAEAPAGTYRYTLTLSNPGASPVPVRLEGAAMGQDTTGAPTFVPGDAPVPLTFQPAELVVPAHAARPVAVSVPVAPSSPGVFEAALAVFGSTPASGDIATQTAVASLLELSGPGVARATAAVESLVATGEGAGRVSIDAGVADTGDVLVAPTATATISTAGSVLATLPLGVVRIVPGATVAVQGEWTAPRRLTGTVTVDLQLSDPSAGASTTVTFERGVAARTAAELRDVQATPTPGGADLTVSVENVGNTAIDPSLDVAQFSHGHWHPPGAARRVGTLAPGTALERSYETALVPGRYELAVRLYEGATLLDQEEVYVDVTGAGSDLPMTVALAMLIALLAAGLVVAIGPWRRPAGTASAPRRLPPPTPSPPSCVADSRASRWATGPPTRPRARDGVP